MEIISKAKPNLAHYSLAELEGRGTLKCLITQNVDGLHRRAGSKRVIELHGSIWRVRCVRCGYRADVEEPPEELPPVCPNCGSPLRPDVVWFGEPIPRGAWEGALEEVSKSDVLLVIGTSGTVVPAALIPRMASERGVTVIEVNPEDTPITKISTFKVSSTAVEFFRRFKLMCKSDFTFSSNRL